MSPLLKPDGIARLREALTAADYTSAGIADRLGPAATETLRRNDFRAAIRRTSGGDPLDTLIRLFVCGQTEPVGAVERALAPVSLEQAVDAGLIELGAGGLRAGLELEPYGDWWVLADLSAGMRPGQPLSADHVLGIGGASTTLAAATVRAPVGTALDLGTGCGVQALHLSTHADRVTATDLSERALRFAATTAALNGLDWELLAGDLAAPVAGRRFDLVVSNPPFVAGPGTTTHTYRDSGRSGDAVCAELVAAAPGLLAEGGTMQFLANWLHLAGQDWQDRVAGWLAGTGLDAWVIQREVSDPVSYVNLWLADAAADPAAQPALAAAWLDWFDANHVTGIGLGLVTLRAAGHDDPTVRLDDLRQTLDEPLGALVPAWFDRQDWLRAHSAAEILAAPLRTADGLQLRQEATRDSAGTWQVDRQLLALTGGARWVEEIDPVILALVSGCDGVVPLRDQLDLLAAAHDVDTDTLAEVAVPVVAHLVERGILLPAAHPAPQPPTRPGT
ncbi:MAG TPA: methyltransferase [Micromonosporaceae bacterium]|nr:methyltransferase [Micromonosporaceae bacterium]